MTNWLNSQRDYNGVVQIGFGPFGVVDLLRWVSIAKVRLPLKVRNRDRLTSKWVPGAMPILEHNGKPLYVATCCCKELYNLNVSSLKFKLYDS